MNERIKELYDQANIRYSVYEILKPRDERKNIPDIFAELIVRECVQAVKNVGGYNEDYHMNAIKKYFGVEE